MRKKILLFSTLLFTGCTTGDIQSITSAALSKNPTIAFQNIAKTKTTQYVVNPTKLINDIKAMDAFLKDFKNNISKFWGVDNIKIPQKTEYVKYMQNYKSRALIDFDKGIVTVETLDNTNAKKSLNEAIVTTLLLPDDPRAADLFGSKPVKLGATPYLLGEVKDDQNKDIRYSWRANRYANILTTTKFQEKEIIKEGKKVKVSYVNIPMVKDHANIRVAKFKPIVKKYAKKYQLSENLVYAIIQTESNFNQFAVSGAGAIGLMQIVPTSAGIDAYKHARGKTWTPTKSYLFNATNNIELGSAYIQILEDKYLKGITNPISREYCVISAYNTGSGNVLKTFNSNRNRATILINKKTPAQVYSTLRERLPYVETRNYLKKVVTYKKQFVNI
jgi:membrane-bound lytic murein transglycosylase C